MKKTSGVLLALLLSLPAWADDLPFQAALSLSSAQLHQDADTAIAHPAQINFNIAYQPLPYAGVELEGSTGVADAQAQVCAATCNSIDYSERSGVLALLRLSWPSGRLRPYLRVGAGDERWQSTVSGSQPQLQAWHVHGAGGGLSWMLDGRSSLFVDALRLQAAQGHIDLFSVGFAQRFDFKGPY